MILFLQFPDKIKPRHLFNTGSLKAGGTMASYPYPFDFDQSSVFLFNFVALFYCFFNSQIDHAWVWYWNKHTKWTNI